MTTYLNQEAARHRAAAYLTDLLTEAAAIAHCSVDDMTTRPHRRHHEAIRGRWVAAYVLREMGLSLPGIGALLDLDHTTVLNALRRLAEDPALWEKADTLAYRFHQAVA